MKREQLTILYDGQCPLCVKEMRHLMKADSQHKIQLADINAPDFTTRFPEVSHQAAMSKLHGYLEDQSSKTLVTGLDVTYHAWRLVGKGWLIAPLRWPVIKVIADYCYLKFAKNRFTLSRWLTGQSRCQSCSIDR
ncbi:thiol-disulfide oxidoreductase DCC family protein [Planctobacterium marinum]|uniref:Redox protein n=1 Tax=Planctobacterium marinum TaxID=1631968 RepID=A0AA48HMX4_9ALTE|nr:redox protein [Planctobacterium marinum]